MYHQKPELRFPPPQSRRHSPNPSQCTYMPDPRSLWHAPRLLSPHVDHLIPLLPGRCEQPCRIGASPAPPAGAFIPVLRSPYAPGCWHQSYTFCSMSSIACMHCARCQLVRLQRAVIELFGWVSLDWEPRLQVPGGEPPLHPTHPCRNHMHSWALPGSRGRGM